MHKVTMLLSNAFMPDPRPYQEALSLIGAGYSVSILCWDRGEGLPEREKVSGIEVERIRIPSKHGRGTAQVFFLIILWVKMAYHAISVKFDIVYCHDLDTLPAGVFLKLFKRKKLVFDSHEVYSRMLSGVASVIKRSAAALERLLVRLPDSVIVTCPAMAKLYRSYGVKNITIVGNWKNLKDFEISNDDVQREKINLGIKKELVISYIANLGREKIIEPFLEVVGEDKEVLLIIGGDGPQKVIVEKKAKLHSNIKYLGYIPAQKVPLYTVLSDIVYYGYDKTSGMAEFNSPNKLFEALAAGRAFIGGDFGQMGQIISEENCGIALTGFDKISIKGAISIMKDEVALNRFKEHAKRAALNKYNWANAEKEFLKTINTL